ncbi:U3 small nucleolar RNA-associated protein 22 [Neonectria ditissima]|uniref:U3 small nucleolar RNA-associated protein 22 n=1 Tax=Neonectria ditissima TaxID=78410 RepID=A0A0P7B9N0_9HYPO|nr:U3 small nucleolar RNA-associated protein 22 [Neonectria ditissima]
MQSSFKRRKLDHSRPGLRHDALIDFESRSSARVSTASTFVLQTDELLKEAKLDYGKALKDVDGHLHRLKEVLSSVSAHDPMPITEATAKFEKKHRIVIPYPEPKPAKDAPYKLSFEKPAQYNVVGSYVARTMVKTQAQFGVDMVIQMPRSMFQDKDYTSMRYFYRRAYYIAHIAAHVKKQIGTSMDLTFEYLNENPLLPILALRPKFEEDDADEEEGEPVVKEANSKTTKKNAAKLPYVIRLIPCAPEGLFPKNKLVPTSNNTRSGDADDKKAAQTGTPFYNSTLKAEETFISYLRLLTHAKNECPAFPDACALGRIWLQQRGFGGSVSQGGFGHFEWAVMIALLLQMGGRNGQAALSTALSSTELFKAAVQFLSTTDFNKKPFVFGSSTINIDFVRESGPVMFDPIRELNILFKMTPWSASLLQSHAKSTTDLLADEAADKFEPTFIIKVDAPLQTFDAMFEIKSPDVSKSSKSPDRRGSAWNFSLDAHKILKKAYGDRAQLIHFQQPPKTSWALSSSHPADANKVIFAVVFDSVNMSRQMEHGPPAEEPKDAARFRQFWGEKAELRRFKDGSIIECVEWSSRGPIEICEEITAHALKRHLKIVKEELTPLGSGLSSIISLTHMDKEAFDAARRSFQTLEYDIRNLEELPLQIRQLSPVSPAARYASIVPPILGFHKGSIEPIDVHLYFEASSKWPENLVAIQEAKIEFLLDFDKRLTTAKDTIATYLGRENKDIGIENLAYLDIIYDNGAAFRLRIHCDMEETLLQRQIQNKTMDPRVRDEAEAVLARSNWLFKTLPLHTQTIATFCTRLHPLSQTIRLVKHWFNSHKLSSHISEELIELFVLHVFLQPYPWRTPSSVATGFLRTLSFISRWDWRDEPLVVDSAETLTSDDRSAVHRELESWRKRDPGMNHTVMIVATSSEPSGLAYTRSGPSKLIASRMTRLAKAACKLLKDSAYSLDAAALFDASLHDYDVLFHLSPKALRAILRDAATDPAARRVSHFKNLDDRTGRAPLPIRAHPIDVLVEELQRVYDDTLIFFRGDNEDDVIGAIWNPKLQQQKFRAGLPYNFRRVDAEEGDVVEVNRQAILLEIARIGGELIKKIEEVE